MLHANNKNNIQTPYLNEQNYITMNNKNGQFRPGSRIRQIIKEQGRKRPLDTPKKMIERREREKERERGKGRRRDIEREGEIRERERERVKGRRQRGREDFYFGDLVNRAKYKK